MLEGTLMSTWVHRDGMSFFTYGFMSGVVKGPVQSESIGVVELAKSKEKRIK